MRYLSLFFGFFFFIPLSFAEPTPKVVTSLQKLYNNVDTWTADFVQTTQTELLNKTIVKKGVISISRPNKVHIVYNEKPVKYYISDGKKFWIYVPQDKQVMVYKKMSEFLSRQALSFLAGIANLQKDYNVEVGYKNELGTEAGFESQDLSTLELIPLIPDESVDRIILGLDSKTFMIKEMTIFNSSGNKTRYLFSEVKFNKKLPDDLFVFKKPKGVKEIKGLTE